MFELKCASSLTAKWAVVDEHRCPETPRTINPTLGSRELEHSKSGSRVVLPEPATGERKHTTKKIPSGIPDHHITAMHLHIRAYMYVYS